MSFLMQARLAGDGTVMGRVAACAAAEGIPQPDVWSWSKRWEFSAQPGWAAAFTNATATEGIDPGANENAITDAMILTAVRAIYIPPPDVPTPDPTESPA